MSNEIECDVNLYVTIYGNIQYKEFDQKRKADSGLIANTVSDSYVLEYEVRKQEE